MFSALKNRMRDNRIAAATDQPTSASQLQEKLLGFLYVPPLDDVASVLMMGIFVWQYSGGLLVRTIRGRLAYTSEVKFTEGLRKARSDYKEAAEAKRKSRSVELDKTSSETSKELAREVKKEAENFVGNFDKLGQDTLMNAVFQGAVAGRRDKSKGLDSEGLQVLLKATRDKLHDTGFTYELQAKLFGPKRAENLSDSAIREVMYLMETGFKDPIELNTGVPRLSPRAAASVAAIRKIKDFDSVTFTPDDNTVALPKFVDPETAQNIEFFGLSVEEADLDVFRQVAEVQIDRDLQRSASREIAVREATSSSYADLS